ncbi:hypothetical protein IMZ48_24385 [Candidatus Bathyarchaeota archaeon]|nr:hypothetical protein [Candidatus Bathyarchaeota archaeon]
MLILQPRSRGFTAAESELAFSPPPGATPPSDDDPSATSDPDPSPSQSGRIELPPTKGRLPLDCPNLDGKTRKIKAQKKEHPFRITCGADSSPGEGDKNIMTLTAYRFADCMRACAMLNERGKVGEGEVCGAVRFNTDMAFVASHGGNCWLKKGFDALVFDKNDDTKNNHAFAELQD